jgi:hypothetical protein
MRFKSKCEKIDVPKSCCYLLFARDVNEYRRRYKNSDSNDFETVRDEQMIIDYDKEGKVLGIELLSSKKAKKPCQGGDG